MIAQRKVLTDEMVAKIEALAPRYPNRQALTLPALHIVNAELRHVPLEAVVEIAQVLACDARHALIDLQGRQEWARIAIPPPAAVSAGDFVVVAGRGSEWWTVGTLGDPWEAADDSAPDFDSDADIVIHAPHGRIALAAAQIWLGGDKVSIFAKALRATATSCVLQCQTVNQWIAGLVSLTVGRLYQGVTGDYHHHSQSIVERAEGQVTIKGDRIHLN